MKRNNIQGLQPLTTEARLNSLQKRVNALEALLLSLGFGTLDGEWQPSQNQAFELAYLDDHTVRLTPVEY